MKRREFIQLGGLAAAWLPAFVFLRGFRGLSLFPQAEGRLPHRQWRPES